MEVAWLQDFLTLAESGHFTRAAARRNISQAAFSRRIKSLEEWLDVQLFDRSTVPASLTLEGQEFHEEATELLSRLLQIQSSLGSAPKRRSSRIKIAMPHVIASSCFSSWWKNWSSETDISVETHIGNVTEVVSEFLVAGSDILICHRSDQLPVLLDPRHFVSKILTRDRLRLYAAQNSQHARLLLSAPYEAQTKFVMYTRGAYFSSMVQSLLERSQTRINGETSVESEMAQVVLECIRSDMGIGWLPDCMITNLKKSNLQLLDIPGLSMPLEIVAYTRRQKQTRAVKLIWQNMS